MPHYSKHTGRWRPLFFFFLLLLFLFLTGLVTTGRAQQSGWPTPTYDETSAEAARAQLEDILNRPEYQWDVSEDNAEPSLWQRIQDWFLDLLFRLLPESAGATNVLSIIVGVVGAIVLALVLAFAARVFLRQFAADSAQVLDELEEEAISAEAAQKQAEQLSSAGDYRTAVRYQYLSALLALDEHGLLRYDRSRTNREYLRSVTGRPALAEALSHVVDVFDAVWYGYKPLDADGYSAYAEQVSYLRRLV